MYNPGHGGSGSAYHPSSRSTSPAPSHDSGHSPMPVSVIADNTTHSAGNLTHDSQSMQPFMQGPQSAAPVAVIPAPYSNRPTISPYAHAHVGYGEWRDDEGRPTGGHILNEDLGNSHPYLPEYQAGQVGWGALPGDDGVEPWQLNPQLNGVYTLKDPKIRFYYDGVVRAYPKYITNHTMFPRGITAAEVRQMADTVWRGTHNKFWLQPAGGPWYGTTTLPSRSPHNGKPIDITGRYDSAGNVTSYWPSPVQTLPAPAPSTGASS